jgi:DNA-binding MarR family transcriptional regulator
LRRAELAVQKAKERRLRAVGMPAAHYSLLMSVNAEPGLSGAELARRLGVTPQAVASLVRRIEGQGELERRPHPRHPHVLELYLTAAGREGLQAADELMSQIDRSLTSALGVADSVHLQANLDRVTDLAGDL